MNWQNPWAWLGIAGVALPVLIHLLGRGHARVHRFPTLRFLRASKLMPTRRTRIHDAGLLALRAGALTAAVAALAQPLLLTAGRRQPVDRGMARALIVDTSASMRRAVPSGAAALTIARAAAESLGAQSAVSIVIETANVPHALHAASEWIARQGRSGEIAVMSDFQSGTLDSVDLRVISRGTGFNPMKIALTPGGSITDSATAGGRMLVSRVTVPPGSTNVEWTIAAKPPTTDASRSDGDQVLLLGAETDRTALEAVRYAATTVPVRLPLDSTRAIAVVFPGYPGARALEDSMRPVSASWMADLILRIGREIDGVQRAGEAVVGGRRRLVLFTDAEPAAFGSARVVAAANAALSSGPPPAEMNPDVIGDTVLAKWKRTAEDIADRPAHPGTDGPSDARWFWLAALALLLVESRLRRPGAVISHAAEAPARAA